MSGLSELDSTMNGARHRATPNVADIRPSGIRRVPSRIRAVTLVDSGQPKIPVGGHFISLSADS